MARKRNVTTQKGEMMKTTVRTLAVLGMIAGLCAGCGEADKPEPVAKPDATKAANWEPETAADKEHDVDDGEDHSGHNH
jgi:hypothetical protein